MIVLGVSCMYVCLHVCMQVWQSDNLTGEGRVASSCAFSPDGRTLAVGDDLGQVSLLDNSWLHRLLDSDVDLTLAGGGEVVSEWRLLGRRSLLAHSPSAAAASSPTPPGSRGRGPGKGAASPGAALVPSMSSASASASEKNHARRAGAGGTVGTIVALQFCRLTALLAASCSQHNLIHLLRLEPQGQGRAASCFTLRRLCVCRGHTSPARSLDFSTDGCTLLSSDARSGCSCLIALRTR